MDKIGKDRFVELALGEFPDLRDEFVEYDGLLHLQMAAVSHKANDAIGKADWNGLSRIYTFVSQIFDVADSDVENAVYVSFVENLDLHGSVLGEQAKALLPPVLQNIADNLWKTD
ncbi:MAG: hypothetical protein ABJB40_07720 [Acidobacteriota bacterium]